MKNRKKLSKEKKEQFKKFKIQREKIFLPDQIKNLPPDIQRIIYYITISNHNKVWFNEHRFKFLSNINHFQVDLDRFINRNSKKGYWVSNSITPWPGSTGVIKNVPVYKNQMKLYKIE